MAAVDDGARLGVAVRRAVVPGDVGEAQADAVTTGAGERRQHVGVDPRARRRRTPTSRRSSALTRRRKPAGQHLLELGQRPDRGLLDPGDRARGRRAQADRDRDGLGVVEQQRRELAAGAEPVAAGDAGRGLDRIAERAQLLDVAADRAGADLEAVGELLTGPFPADLQQREEGEEASGGLNHGAAQRATDCGL